MFRRPWASEFAKQEFVDDPAHVHRASTLVAAAVAGGVHNALHMKAAFEQVTLVDLAAGMLAVSRELNPELEHIEGDMRTLRLGR